MKGAKILGLALALASLTLLGCDKTEESIPGKWVGKTGTFQFAKDKSGVVTPAQVRAGIPAMVPFKWSMEGSDEVKILIPGAGNKTTYGKLQGKDVLVIEDDKFVKQP